MARKKMHEDNDILALLSLFWDEQCEKKPDKLTYPSFAKFLNSHGIGYDSNALKHRPAVVDSVRRLKAGLPASIAKDTESAQPAAAEAAEYIALKKKYKELLRLVCQTYADSACAQILKEHGEPSAGRDVLKPEAAGKAAVRIGENPFENEFVRKMAGFAGFDVKEGYSGTETE